MTRGELILTLIESAEANLAAARALLADEKTPTVAGPCDHPESKRKPQPVGGDPGQYLCTKCLALVPGKETP